MAESQNNLFNLNGKTAVVTGGAGGIGSAVCQTLAAAGAHVFIHYRTSKEKALALVEHISRAGGEATAIPADVTVKSDVEKLFDAVHEQSDTADILINNAGTYPVSPFLDISEEEYGSMMDSNVRSVVLCTQAFSKHIIKRGRSGVIVNIASIAASGVLDRHSHYCAAKSAVVMLTKSTARELGGYHIRVNAVSPGLIRRDGIDEEWPEGIRRFKQASALNTVGEAEDVANACLFLVSNASKWITGIDLVVDGGVLTEKIF